MKPISKPVFEQMARREGWNETMLKRFEPIAYGRFEQLRDERLKLSFLVGHDLQSWETDWFHTARVLDGIEIVAPGAEGINLINRTLRQMKLPVLLSTLSSHELRRRMRLPPLFELYDMQGRGGNVRGTIAFGRQALMLDALLYGRRDLLPPQSAVIS